MSVFSFKDMFKKTFILMGLKYVLNFKHTFKYFLKQDLIVLKLLCEFKATLLECCRNSHIYAWK